MPSPVPLLSRRHFVAGGASLIALPGCGGDGGSPQLAMALRELPQHIQQMMQETGVPGVAAAVVYRGETVWSRGFGLRAVDRAEAVDADTVFQLASVSKSVGATVVARQVGDGRLAWTSRMRDLLPEAFSPAFLPA